MDVRWITVTEVTMVDNRRRRPCEQLKPNGRQCRARALTGSKFCFFHAPEKAEERKAARRAGGVERARKVVVLPPDTCDRFLGNASQVLDLLSLTVSQVLRGELDPKVANCVGFLAGVTLKALEQTGVEEGRLSEKPTVKT
jgi:hypothetical protein